ncbi:FHA domain-containing protein [Morganella morganii]|uniref:FHA domain-containing protein n=1 Tax=Morganella sp. GD04133 TaxID=2975435 RepID=UPI00244D49DE|nr:FHA domain-containing protein [Morganella sp. GD04133]MDH0353281.1 FHA domain-containing protein [Morganella sp. GD04133]
MSLTIRIVSAPEHSSTLPQYCFDGRDGTIGRDAQADIVLDDPHSRIEDTHATFRCTTAGYILTDTSRDGVFINNRQEALGHGTDYLLQDGDMLGIGAFRLLVSCFSPLSSAPQPLSTADEETALHSLFTPADDNSCFDDDPFLGTAPVKKPAPHDIRYRFSAVARPYGSPVPAPEPVAQPEIVPVITAPSPVILPPLPPVPAGDKLVLLQSLLPEISQALSAAAEKIIRDISPQHLEALHRDQKIAGKIDYWQTYKRFFSQQIADDNLKNKLTDYFRSEFYTRIIQSS